MLLLLSLYIVSAVAAASGNGFVKFHVSRRKSASSNKLIKRDTSPINAYMEDQGNFYGVDLEMGSDHQHINVQLDTGSSDLWVEWSDNPYCEALDNHDYDYDLAQESRDPAVLSALETLCPSMYSYYESRATQTQHPTPAQPEGSPTPYANYPTATFDFVATQTAVAAWYYEGFNCSRYGMFDHSTSNTFESNRTRFDISYVDGSYSIGVYARDQIEVDGITITNATFGLGLMSTSNEGVFGIGFPNYEATSNDYRNFPYLLKDQGHIDRVAYSLYLGGEGANESHVIFGGVDTAKFQGSLTVLPCVPAYGLGASTKTIAVTLSAIYATNVDNMGPEASAGAGNTKVLAYGLGSAYFDVGTTTGAVPYYILNAIIDAYRNTLKYSATLGAYVANCGELEGKSLVLDFQGAQVEMPLFSFMFNVVNADRSNTGLCALGIGNSGNNDFLLGDMFLKNIYFVVDMENQELALAPAVADGSHENIVPIASGTAPLPSATSATSWSATYGSMDVTYLSVPTPYDVNNFQTTEIDATLIQDGMIPIATS